MAASAFLSLASLYLSTSRPPISLSSNHLHPCTLRRTITTINNHIDFSFFPRRKTLPKNLSSPPTDSKSQQPTNVDESHEPKEEQQQPPPLSLPSDDKKSFAVTTGEVFVGIASRLVKTLKRKPGGNGAAEFESESSNAKSVLVGEDSVPTWRSSVGRGGSLTYGERTGSVVKDSLEPGVIWEQRVKDVEAEKRRKEVTSTGVSFSAAGLLFPYYLGVAQCLIEKGYIKETTPLAGSSAGAIICAAIASGTSTEEALKFTKELADDCRLKGTAFRLGAVLREVLEKMLPDDAHTRCNGRVCVGVTRIFWRPRGLLVDHFHSKEDLINAVFTSSFIPFYLAARPATLFRNRLCVDGGLTLFMPTTSAARTVRVCAFRASTLRLQGVGISPDCNPENRPSTLQLFIWALKPAEDYVLDKLFEFGYMDASVWAEQNPIDSIVEEGEF